LDSKKRLDCQLGQMFMRSKKMTRSPNTAYLSPTHLQRSLLMPGLGCLAGVGLLGGVLDETQMAQAATEVAIPTSEVTIEQNVAPAPLDVAPPESIPELPEAVLPISPTSAPVVEQPISGNEATIVQIDRSGAKPDSYEAPNAVILSERSSGCQAVVNRGQGVSGELCPSPIVETNVGASSSQVASAQRSGNPFRMGVSGISARGGNSDSGWQAYYKVTARPRNQLGNNNLRLLFPLPIPAVITSAFGWRVHPISGDRRFHSGTDIGAPMGTPVLAAYAGRVAIADFLGGYGLTVTLDHKEGTQQTLYAHLSEIFVRPGEWVPQGTVIGRVGSTGNSTGPHLHFELLESTQEGWVALDAGMQLEFALAQLVRSLQVAQANTRRS
jgi:hypothetical protein